MYSLVFLYKHHISVININSWSVPFVHSYSGIYYPYSLIMASGKKKRLYSDEYIKYGFISIHINNIERPQCVICLKTLSADSMKPSLLNRHLETCHPEIKDKDASYFQRKESGARKVRLDTTGTFNQLSISAIETSYVISLKIAQQKKPHLGKL